jgi:hypothetical protein
MLSIAMIHGVSHGRRIEWAARPLDGADCLITDGADESDQDGSGLPACSEEM